MIRSETTWDFFKFFTPFIWSVTVSYPLILVEKRLGIASLVSRILFLTPHLQFICSRGLESRISPLFDGMWDAIVQEDVDGFKALYKIYAGDTSVDVDVIKGLFDGLSQGRIDTIEWRIGQEERKALWILRSILSLRDETFLSSIRLKCSTYRKGEEAPWRFTLDEAAFLLGLKEIESIITFLFDRGIHVKDVLRAIASIKNIGEIITWMEGEILASFQPGDLLFEDVSLKMSLFGIHMRAMQIFGFLKEGEAWDLGVLDTEEKDLFVNKFGKKGSSGSHVPLFYFLQVSAFRFSNEELQKRVLELSREVPNRSLPNANNKADFVSEWISRAYSEIYPNALPLFKESDTGLITPITLLHRLEEKGLGHVVVFPSRRSHQFLEL